MKKKVSLDREIERVFSNPRSSAAFRGIQAVHRALKEKKIKVTEQQVRNWLLKSDTFTLHRPVKYKFKRRRIEVRGIGCLIEADLMDFPKLAPANDNFRYILTCIDVFSKRAQAISLKTKSGHEVTQAMKSLFDAGFKPLFLRTDSGKEFKNREFQQMLESYNVHFYTSLNETKCAIVERFNLTLANAIGRYMTHNSTHTYIDVLDDLMHSYNNTYHSQIRMKPSQVSKSNEREVFHNLYGKSDNSKTSKCKFNVGDSVRISKAKRHFKKNYKQSWTVEVFKVSKVYRTAPCVYELMDENSETLIGRFYANELTKIRERQIYRIEKILKHKKIRGKEHIYVKWLNYDTSHNSWILSNSLQSA
jgi:hypothetical protein